MYIDSQLSYFLFFYLFIFFIFFLFLEDSINFSFWTLCCNDLQNTLATDSKKKASGPATGKNNLPHQHLIHEQVERQEWQPAQQRRQAVALPSTFWAS